ncbi:uncharacterized protein LOC131670599 isoform X1 [Phymastichus coffea]|uniref:uncharacterized protein LOC131670599 isoform X1 n=1 Tax=Phymastichus coffea TaxID=108790 RepID=UPI00273CB1A7|nr:uncharacterized protein LOC131670599 isoform X1 [Phymastichus coffea]
MTRKYVIIVDEKSNKIIIPSRWLSYDRKSYSFPPNNVSTADIKQAIVDDTDPDENYVEKPLQKVVKFCLDYPTAVEEKNLHGIENVTDPSDAENLKRTRKRRNKKRLSNDYVIPKKRNPLEEVNYNSESNDTDGNDDSLQQDPLAIEKSPSYATLNLEGISAQVNVLQPNKSSVSNVATKQISCNQFQDSDVDEIEEMGRETAPSLQKIYDMQKLILRKVNYLTKKQESNEKLLKNQRRQFQVSSKPNVLSQDHLKMLNEHFPIDADVNNEKKKIDKVEAQLLHKKFAKAVMPCSSAATGREKTLSLNGILDKCCNQGNQILLDVEHLQGAGGVNVHDLIYNMVPKLINDEVLQNYSFYGRKSRGEEKNKCFSELYICKCIYTASKLSFPKATDDDIKKSLCSFLDQASTRFKRSQKSNRKSDSFILPLQLDGTDDKSDHA